MRVEDEVVGEIGPGLCVLLGVAREDDEAAAERLAGRVARLRIFENEEGKFDRSVLDAGGAALVVSQFTLIADSAKGNRPSFSEALRPSWPSRSTSVLLSAPRARRPGRDRRLRRAHARRARERRSGDDPAGRLEGLREREGKWRSARPVMMDRLPHFPPDPSSGFGGPAPPGSHELRASTRIGTEVAGFRIESVLGRGGMSVVYVAEQMRLARKVALKVLTNELAWDEQFRERFVRESHIAATIDHPNIIPIYDAGEADGLLYIAMRFVQGPDLKEILKRGPLGVGRTIFLIEQLASALDAAHAHALVHRDVKPGNILVEESTDHAYLTDFGVAKQTTARGLTSTGHFLGTVEYAAPEQIEGRTGRRAHRRLCARLRPLRVPDRVAAFCARHGTRRPARAPRRSAAVREPCSARPAPGVRQRGCDRDGEGGGGPVRHRAESSPTPLVTRRAERRGGSTAARRVTWRRSPRLRLPPRPRGRSRSPRPLPPSYRPSPLRRLESRPARD